MLFLSGPGSGQGGKNLYPKQSHARTRDESPEMSFFTLGGRWLEAFGRAASDSDDADVVPQ